MKKNKIFYIDPQSMRNLSVYDYNMLSEVTDNVYYYCSVYLDYKRNPNLFYKTVFSYNHINVNFIKALSYALSLIRILLDIVILKPDVIHVQWFKLPILDYYFYSFVKRISHAKLIFTAHNVLPHNTGIKYLGVYRKLYGLMDKISVHIERTKHEIIEQFSINENKISIVRHGLLHQTYDKEKYKSEKDEFDKKYNLEGKFVITTLGEQSRYKGIDELVRVWANTSELANDDSCRLLIAGKSVDLDFSEIKSIKNVIIEDRKIPNEEFYYILKSSDICLFPYRKISASGALLTALTEHVPIMVSDVGGLAEPLKIANVGISIPDINYLAEGLLYIVSHKEEFLKIKCDIESWEKIEDYYSWTTISKLNQKLYDSLCEK